jgi:uncharacterized protein (DUF488 family)
MNIFTGYLAQAKNYTEAGYEPISIARFNRFFTGKKYPNLAPHPSWLKDSEQVYRPKFEALLDKLSPAEVLEDLEKLSDSKDVVLLCYEKPGEFCHRHMVADWLQKQLGIEIKELGKMK